MRCAELEGMAETSVRTRRKINKNSKKNVCLFFGCVYLIWFVRQVAVMQFEEIQSFAVNEHLRLIVCDPDGDGIYLVGGKRRNYVNADDTRTNCMTKVWKFNMAARTWTQLRSDNPPVSLLGHRLVNLGRTVNNGPSRLLMFGGKLPINGLSNNAYVYDVHDDRWENIVTSGQSPCNFIHSCGQAMAKYGAYLYVATGRQDINCTEIHRLNLQSFVWEEVSVGKLDSPACSSDFEIVVDDDRVYIVTGRVRGRGRGNWENIPCFDTKTDRWGVFPTLRDAINGYPLTRSWFRCVTYEGNMYIVGGRNYENDNDGLPSCRELWRMDLKTGQWCKLPISFPRPLCLHSADVDRDGVLYVFGGCTGVNSEWTTQLWRARVVVQPLKRLAWDKILSCISRQVISSNDKLLDTLPLPPSFVQSKFTW